MSETVHHRLTIPIEHAGHRLDQVLAEMLDGYSRTRIKEWIDAGQVLPGLNNGFKGGAPDIGAFELGSELPHYGPRLEKDQATADSK